MRIQLPLNIVLRITALRCVALLLAVGNSRVCDATRVQAQVVAGDPIATAAFAALSRLSGNARGITFTGSSSAWPSTPRPRRHPALG